MKAHSYSAQVAYLAGPMRGYAEYNFPAFHAAAAKLRGHGLKVWSPAEHDVNEDGFDPATDTAQPMRHYMKRDLPAVLEADMVCVLPGWEKSQGACLEVHVARTCGIPVYWAENMMPVAAPAGPTREGWIPVIERMPANGEVVLIAGLKGLYVTGIYDDGGWWTWSDMHEDWSAGLADSFITHWMPRPKHPESAATSREGNG